MSDLPSDIQHEPFDIRDLDYELPTELIAQQPLPMRDDSRLLIVGRDSDRLVDASVKVLAGLLLPGDLLILNDTKVLPARIALRRESGGLVEGLFLRETEGDCWDVLLRKAQRCKEGEILRFLFEGPDQWSLRLVRRGVKGAWLVQVCPHTPAEVVLAQVGKAPLPPYIKRPRPTAQESRQSEAIEQEKQDRLRYQTVYAKSPGAVAAPTAGLHLTHDALEAMRKRQVEVATVTLHVGLGTFQPLEVDSLQDHKMHSEWFDLPDATAQAVRSCRERDGRVVAVGTTAVRVLEHCADDDGAVEAQTGQTNIFIYPPYEFRVVDALLTNLHLPRSTLLAMIMALGGTQRVRRAYQHAINARYRFYSYGDAMFLT